MFQDFPRNLKGRRSPWGGVSLSCAKFGSSPFSVAPSYKKLCPYVCIYLLVGWSVGWLNRHKFGLSPQTGRARRISSSLYISYFPAFISYTYVFTQQAHPGNSMRHLRDLSTGVTDTRTEGRRDGQTLL